MNGRNIKSLRKSPETEALVASLHRDLRRRDGAVLAGLGLLTAAMVAATLMVGEITYGPKTVLAVMKGATMAKATFAIRSLRLPRAVIGGLAGFAFGVAGHLFQKLLKNPLASPDIIGITAGSGVAAVFGITVLGLSGVWLSSFALAAGVAVVSLIYGLSRGPGYTDGRLILVGIGMQAFLHASVNIMILRAAPYDVAGALQWLSGSLQRADLSQAPGLAVAVASGLGLALSWSRALALMDLGEAYAMTAGLHVEGARRGLIAAGLILTAFATSRTGPIAAVSFLCGPIARHLARGEKSRIIAAGLVGALLVLGADLAGQHLFSARYPVGVITGVLGAPYLLYLLVGLNRKEVSV